MEYQQGSFGRVFLLRFDDRDDLLGEIKKVAVKEQIKNGTITLLGGMRSEIVGIDARKALDEKTGVAMPALSAPRRI